MDSSGIGPESPDCQPDVMPLYYEPARTPIGFLRLTFPSKYHNNVYITNQNLFFMEEKSIEKIVKSKIDFPAPIGEVDVVPLIGYLSRTGNCQIEYNLIYVGLEPANLNGKSKKDLKGVHCWIGDRNDGLAFSLRRDSDCGEFGYFNGLDFDLDDLYSERLTPEHANLLERFRENIYGYFSQRC